MTLEQQLTAFLEAQHGTAGWETKLLRFIECRIAEARLNFVPPYSVSEWEKIGRERGYWDYFKKKLAECESEEKV
jgi:hypothetical protein